MSATMNIHGVVNLTTVDSTLVSSDGRNAWPITTITLICENHEGLTDTFVLTAFRKESDNGNS